MTTNNNLQQLLSALEASLRSDPPRVADLTARATAVLDFLNLPENNTDGNCRAIDSFIGLRMLDDAAANQNLTRLPPVLAGIIQDMGMCLHDAHTAPEIARAFESTPNQLLARVQRFQEQQDREEGL